MAKGLKVYSEQAKLLKVSLKIHTFEYICFKNN